MGIAVATVKKFFAVAALRMEAAQDPDDPAVATLVGQLSVQHEDFRTWWAAHKVTAATTGRKQYRLRSSATCRSIATCRTAPTEAGSD